MDTENLGGYWEYESWDCWSEFQCALILKYFSIELCLHTYFAIFYLYFLIDLSCANLNNLIVSYLIEFEFPPIFEKPVRGMACWQDLPFELQEMVLEILGSNPGYKSENPHRATYAAVSRTWQVFFEQKTFRRVVVTSERLSELEKLTRDGNEHRRFYIRHLWLQVKLPEYDCPSCREQEQDKTIREWVITWSHAI